uniref:Uncharacterized protein n=1 Tax=Biomphalaria glabrata TaxID=6526 RepID=A0A2C9M6K6_BIOGL
MPLSRQNKVSPLSTDVKVSQPNNVDGASKSPGDDLDKQIQEIRDLARPLAVKRDLYHKLLIQSPGSSTLASRQRNSVRAKTRFLYQHWSNVRYSLTPWGRSLKTIEVLNPKPSVSSSGTSSPIAMGKTTKEKNRRNSNTFSPKIHLRN